VLATPAQRDLRRLEEALRQRILQAIRRYTNEGLGDVVKLRGRQEEWRLRVGEYRVRFRRDTANRTIVVLRVQPRREAYR
jgi:mRNA interferase RelE/StbE